MSALCRHLQTHTHTLPADMATGAAAMVLLLCVVFALHALTEAQEGGLKCLRAGGICMLLEDCPPGSLSDTRGLCTQKGHDCCHGLPLSERRCHARGGVCRPKTKCGRALWDERAEDCATGEACCTLVS